MTEPDSPRLRLWSDDPSPMDLLSFDAVAATIADALLDKALDPVALGLSGAWGSGKTTVLALVEQELEARASADTRVLVITTEPWRYDPLTGSKESLIGEVLAALAAEVEASGTTVKGAKEKAGKLVAKLLQRIDWAKAVKLAAKTSLAFQLPSINDIVELIKPAESAEGAEEQVRGLEAFRVEFADLMGSDALAHLQAVAVLVDDLDRCLPETVIESLEAIRLFLSVPKMSFVIAADEDRIADAIRTRFADTGAPAEKGHDGDEEPAKLYLHKIVQTTIPLPTLSRFDTQAFLLLLQLEAHLDKDNFGKIVEQCATIRRDGGGLDDLTPIEGVEMSDQLAFASRLTPILYEKLHGNPRRIKRFLNDLQVRQTIAARRGITLDPAVVAKLMVLEVLLPDDFKKVLAWLAQGAMRTQLTKLEAASGRAAGPNTEAPIEVPRETETAADAKTDGQPAAEVTATATAEEGTGEFGEALLRWAKLPPPLDGVDLAPYLHLAASFSGVTLVDSALPERLRDIAANLLSTSAVDRQAVGDTDIDALTVAEAEELLLHIGRTIRDDPNKQKTGVTGILRLTRHKAEVVDAARKALRMLPADDLQIGTPLLFKKGDPAALFELLTIWKKQASSQPVLAAIDHALGEQAS